MARTPSPARETRALPQFGELPSRLEKLALRAGRRFQPKLPIRIRGCDAALRGPLDVTFHDQIRLVHFLERARFFPDRDGERIQSNRATTEFVDQRIDDEFVPLLEPV